MLVCDALRLVEDTTHVAIGAMLLARYDALMFQMSTQVIEIGLKKEENLITKSTLLKELRRNKRFI